MTNNPEKAPPTITDPASVLELLVALMATSQPEWAERTYRQLFELSLEIASGREALPERQHQALRQLLALVERFRPDAEDPQPNAQRPTLADVRALLAAFRRGDAR